MKRILIAVIFLLSLPSWASWTVTNDKQAVAASVTFTTNLSNPSTIIVVCRAANIDPPIGVPTDTAGNSYVDSGLGYVQVNAGTPRDSMIIYVANNTHTTASNVVTCNFGGATVFIEAAEITGCNPCGIVDGKASSIHQTASSGANTVISTSYNTTINGDFIFFTFFDQGGASGYSAGTSPLTFTLMPFTPTITVSEETTQATHGSIAPTAGFSSGGPITWGGMSIAIAPANAVIGSQIGAFIVGP